MHQETHSFPRKNVLSTRFVRNAFYIFFPEMNSYFMNTNQDHTQVYAHMSVHTCRSVALKASAIANYLLKISAFSTNV